MHHDTSCPFGTKPRRCCVSPEAAAERVKATLPAAASREQRSFISGVGARRAPGARSEETAQRQSRMLLSSHAGRPRPATSDKTKGSQAQARPTASMRVSSPPGRDHLHRVGRHRRPESKQQASMQHSSAYGRMRHWACRSSASRIDRLGRLHSLRQSAGSASSPRSPSARAPSNGCVGLWLVRVALRTAWATTGTGALARARAPLSARRRLLGCEAAPPRARITSPGSRPGSRW
jgi:hypothetical protein